LVLNIDLGFEVFKKQRLRLAAIDAPPLASDEGRAAREFVLRELALADFIVLRSQWLDIYGRYVGHVFYAHRDMNAVQIFQKGYYLSQRLLDAGHAVVFQ
jgi:endonuclease YncB( thermonuclease family)